MDLKDTIEMMESEDYKERFKAEFYQLKIRIVGLDNMLNAWRAGKLDFEPTCPIETYQFQLTIMRQYKSALLVRAIMERIEIDDTLEAV